MEFFREREGCSSLDLDLLSLLLDLDLITLRADFGSEVSVSHISPKSDEIWGTLGSIDGTELAGRR